MAYNADAHVKALDRPAFVAGGRVYRGRVLSTEEYVQLLAVIQEKETADSDERRMQESRRKMEYAVAQWFPRQWWQLGNPSLRAFRKLPDAVQIAAIADFTQSQRKAMPQPPGTSEPGATR